AAKTPNRLSVRSSNLYQVGVSHVIHAVPRHFSSASPGEEPANRATTSQACSPWADVKGDARRYPARLDETTDRFGRCWSMMVAETNASPTLIAWSSPQWGHWMRMPTVRMRANESSSV